MRVLRRIELTCGLLAGALGIVSTVLPLVMHGNSAMIVLRNGRVLSDAHQAVWLWDSIGIRNTILLLLIGFLLAAGIALAAVFHTTAGYVTPELGVLWLASFGLLILTMATTIPAPMLYAPSMLLGFACALTATWRQRQRLQAGF